MVTDTSLKAYCQIKDEGVLGKMEELVYDYVIINPNQTDAEIAVGLGFERDFNKTRPRRHGCVKKGLIEQSGKRECTVNKGRTAKTWRATL